MSDVPRVLPRGRIAYLVAALLCAGVAASDARAAWPGANGGHVYTVGPDPSQPELDLWLMNADGSGQRPLLTGPAVDTEPSFAPDGRRIAFMSDRGGGTHVWVVGIDGSGLRQVTHGAYEDVVPSWSPDGRKIVFGRLLARREDDPDARQPLFVQKVRGGRARQLTFPGPGVRDSFAQYRPRGRGIIFHREQEGVRSIWILDRRRREPRPLLARPGRNVQQPNWSPDGRRFAFTSNLEDGADPEIYVADADGSNLRRLTDNAYIEAGGTFSPDGTQVSFASCRGPADNPLGDCDTFAVDIATGAERPLATGPGGQVRADWQPLARRRCQRRVP